MLYCCNCCTAVKPIRYHLVSDVSTAREFGVLLTVHLSIILVTDQLNAQILVL